MEYYSLPANKSFLISQKAFIVKDGKVLLLKCCDHGKYVLPGGLLELDEDFNSGLIREVKEESGLQIKVGNICAVWDFSLDGFIFKDGSKKDARIINIGYICESVLKDEEPITLSDEHIGYLWANLDVLDNINFCNTLTSAAMKQFLQYKNFSTLPQFHS